MRAADQALAGRAPAPRSPVASTVVQRDAAPVDNASAEADHKAIQKTIYAWLAPGNVWSQTRRGTAPTGNLPPDQKAKDPDVLFDNSVGWLRSGAVTLTVLTLAPGQTGTERTALSSPTLTQT